MCLVSTSPLAPSANREAQECLDRLTDAGFFAGSLNRTTVDNHDAGGQELTHDNDNVLEDEWKDTYEKRKAAWKLETRQDEAENETEPTMTINQIGDSTDVMADDLPTIGDVDMAENAGDARCNGETLMIKVVSGPLCAETTPGNDSSLRVTNRFLSSLPLLTETTMNH